MKLLKRLTCLLILMGVGVGNVDAATLSIGDDSTSAGAANKSVTVELKDDDLKNYTKLEFELTVSGTSYADIEFTPKATSMAFEKKDNVYIITAEDAKESSEESTQPGLYAATIGTISYKTSENLNSGFKITPTNVKFYKADGTIVTPSDGGVKIDEGVIKYEEPKSSDATLMSLVVSQGELSPKFDSNITEYKVTVPDTINVIKITGTPADGATKTGTGNKTLELGENKFEVVVTAEDGETKKTYTIIVNRGEITTPSAFLKSFKINNIGCSLSPEFDKNNNKYTVEATSDITELDLKYELEDPNANVSITGNEKFVVGENLVTLTIKSSDGKDEQVYEIVVNVAEKESHNKPATPIEEEEPKEKENYLWLIILIVSIIIILVVSIGIILFKRKKKTNKNKEKSNVESNSMNKEVLPEKIQISNNELTETFEQKDLVSSKPNNEEINLEKTKEFNFKDFK